MSRVDTCEGLLNLIGAQLQELERKTRKLLPIHGRHYPQAGIDKLYFKRTVEERGLISVEDCVRTI